MPKPTTHTDIVVVTKQDPPTAMLSETVSVVLVSDWTDSATIHATDESFAEAPSNTNGRIDSLPVRLVLTKGRESIDIGYRIKATVGSGNQTRDLYGTLKNEPNTTSADTAHPALDRAKWSNGAAEAFIAQLDIELYGTASQGTITATLRHSTSGGLKLATAEFKLGSTVVAALQLTASMDATLA